jgi:hypothetical protein
MALLMNKFEGNKINQLDLIYHYTFYYTLKTIYWISNKSSYGLAVSS